MWVFWAGTRTVLLALVWVGHALGAQQGVLGDVRLYGGWGTAFVHGHGLPVGDEKWQYPPVAILVFAVPAAVHSATGLLYRIGFPLFMLLLDAAVTAVLARVGGSGRWPGPGARVWLVGTAALGPVILARFDLVPAASVLLGLLALGGARYGRAGAAAAAGALVKVWPAFLLIAAGRSGSWAPGPASGRPGPLGRLGRLGRVGWLAAGALAAAVAGFALVAVGARGHLLGFLGAQQARGLQLEAVPATGFVVIRMFGAGETARYEYGSLQFGDPAARTVATVCSLAELVLVAAAALRWWLPWPPRFARAGAGLRRTGEDPSSRPAGAGGGAAGGRAEAVAAGDRLLALLLVVLVTSRVLSPQYLIWVLAVVATLVTLGAATPPAAASPGGGELALRRRRVVVLLLVVTLVSQLIYPWRYNDVIQGRVVMSLVLVARNLLLLVTCWQAILVAAARPAHSAADRRRVRRYGRGSRPGRDHTV
jgi:hypothetical protein